MDYWPSVRSRWLDIGQVLFLRVYGPRRSSGSQSQRKIWFILPAHGASRIIKIDNVNYATVFCWKEN